MQGQRRFAETLEAVAAFPRLNRESAGQLVGEPAAAPLVVVVAEPNWPTGQQSRSGTRRRELPAKGAWQLLSQSHLRVGQSRAAREAAIQDGKYLAGIRSHKNPLEKQF